MKELLKDALTALKSTGHTDCDWNFVAITIRRIEAALTEPQPLEQSVAPQAATEGVVERLHLHRLTGDQVASPDGAFVRYDEVVHILARRLNEQRGMVTREAIGKAFVRHSNSVQGLDAVHALQLTAPSAPSSSGEVPAFIMNDLKDIEEWSVVGKMTEAGMREALKFINFLAKRSIEWSKGAR